MSEDTRLIVRGQLVRCIADRTKYKNYAPEVWFDRLFVDIPVPASEAYWQEGVGTVVTLDGLMLHILDPLATALDSMHDQWEVKRAQFLAKRDIDAQHNIKPKKKETQVDA